MGRPVGSRNKASIADGNTLRNSFTVDGETLHSYVERAENVNQQIADCQSDRRELYAEIKRAGYDAPTVRSIVKRRAMDADKRYAMEALMLEYIAALGDYASTPLGQAGAEKLREAAE